MPDQRKSEDKNDKKVSSSIEIPKDYAVCEVSVPIADANIKSADRQSVYCYPIRKGRGE